MKMFIIQKGRSHGIEVNMMDCDITVSKFSHTVTFTFVLVSFEKATSSTIF